MCDQRNSGLNKRQGLKELKGPAKWQGFFYVYTTPIYSETNQTRPGWFPVENYIFPYALPIDFRYLFDLRSPILDAFFLTVSVLRPNFLAILEVGLVGKSFFSRLISAFDQRPFGAFFLFTTFFFFAILCFLSLNDTQLNSLLVSWHCNYLKYNLWLIFHSVKTFQQC